MWAPTRQTVSLLQSEPWRSGRSSEGLTQVWPAGWPEGAAAHRKRTPTTSCLDRRRRGHHWGGGGRTGKIWFNKHDNSSIKTYFHLFQFWQKSCQRSVLPAPCSCDHRAGQQCVPVSSLSGASQLAEPRTCDHRHLVLHLQEHRWLHADLKMHTEARLV